MFFVTKKRNIIINGLKYHNGINIFYVFKGKIILFIDGIYNIFFNLYILQKDYFISILVLFLRLLCNNIIPT